MAAGSHILDTFFSPRSAALVGVTTGFGFGAALPRFLVRYGALERLYLVNPNLREIEGHRVYPSVSELPSAVDLAVILVPAAVVPEVARECAGKGIKALIVMSAGFAETGQEGRARQEELARTVASSGTRMLGPNCIGVVNVHRRFATCELILEEITPGPISIVAQSGLFGNILLDWAPSQHIPIAKVATIGNRVDLDETDCVEYLGRDSATEVIVCYLESLKRPLKFLEIARETSSRKPIVVYLGGRTEAGRRAILSHTGSLGGAKRIEEALLRQAGVHTASDPVELFDVARTFAFAPLPCGNRVVVVTASGSLGVMAADALLEQGMSVPPLPEVTREAVRLKAPPWMTVGNPLDVGPSGLFAEALEAALAAPGMDAVLAFPIIPWAVVAPLLEGHNSDALRDLFVPARLKSASEPPARPMVLSVPGRPEWREQIRAFFGPKIPITATPHSAAKAVAALYRHARWREARKGAGRS